MRVSFDVDDTLVVFGDNASHESDRVPWLLRPWFAEPLRAGARDLMRGLTAQGHELWIYTTSLREALYMKRWLGFYGVKISGTVNAVTHAEALRGRNRPPTKLPKLWNIALHIDDSDWVEQEGRDHGFNVCRIASDDADWTNKVRATVAALVVDKAISAADE